MKTTLPAYSTRRKRDGKVLIQKRMAGRLVQYVAETQFPDGEPVPFALHQEIERFTQGPAPVIPGKDMAAVIRHYFASNKYQKLAPRTAQDYDKMIAPWGEQIGHVEPRRISRKHVIEWTAKIAKIRTPHHANYRLRILRVLLETAIDMGLIERNPAKGVSEVVYDQKQSQPWPMSLVRDAREVAKDRTQLLFELLIQTGQRIGDVLSMKWSDYDGEAVHVVQNKTKKELWLPVDVALRCLLDAKDRTSVFILTNARGTAPWSYRAAADAMMKLRKAIGAEEHNIHALRHTAAHVLAEAGHSDETIQAITGHSTLAMVERYTGNARQKARALRTVKE